MLTHLRVVQACLSVMTAEVSSYNRAPAMHKASDSYNQALCRGSLQTVEADHSPSILLYECTPQGGPSNL